MASTSRRAALRLLALFVALAVGSAATINIQNAAQSCSGDSCAGATSGQYVWGPGSPKSGYSGSYRLSTAASAAGKTSVVSATASPSASVSSLALSAISSIRYNVMRTTAGTVRPIFTAKLDATTDGLLAHRPAAFASGAWQTVDATTAGVFWVIKAGYSGDCSDESKNCNWAALKTAFGSATLHATPEIGFRLEGDAAAAAVAIDSATVSSTSLSKSDTFLFSDHCPITHCNGGAAGCTKAQLPGRTSRVWTCNTCKSGFVRGNDRRSCICPAGKFESNGECVRCARGSYCAGGNKATVERDLRIDASNEPMSAATSATQRGPTASCNPGGGSGITSPFSSKAISDCVAKKGYKITSATLDNASTMTSSVCEADAYSLGGRITECTTCPNGLKTNGAADADHDALTDCKVPPGSYWDSRTSAKVILCPKGTYRADYINGWQNSQCTKCMDGATTGPVGENGKGKTSSAACNVIRAGYSATVPSGSTISGTQLCSFGAWSAERDASTGTAACTACTLGTTTEAKGSKTSGACVANNEVDDVMVDCPANPSNNDFGWDVVPAGADATEKVGQSFQVTEAGKITLIKVWLWGHPDAASTYTLQLFNNAGGAFSTALAASTNTASVDPVGSDCAVDDMGACLDGQFVEFAFNNVDVVTGTTYAWRLTCTSETCGFFGFCDYEGALSTGVAFAGDEAVSPGVDNAFVVTLVPTTAAPLRAPVGGRRLLALA